MITTSVIIVQINHVPVSTIHEFPKEKINELKIFLGHFVHVSYVKDTLFKALRQEGRGVHSEGGFLSSKCCNQDDEG